MNLISFSMPDLEPKRVEVGWCHDFHLLFSKSKAPEHSFNDFHKFKAPEHSFKSRHNVILPYLFLISLKLQVTPIKTRKADSIGIQIKNYLLRGRSNDPFILLIRIPQSIEVQLVISLVSTMQPSLIIRLPVQVLVNDGLVDGQTRNLVWETDIRKRRRSGMEGNLLWNNGRRIGQLLDHPLEGLNLSLKISNLKLTLPGILSILRIKNEVKEDTP